MRRVGNSHPPLTTASLVLMLPYPSPHTAFSVATSAKTSRKKADGAWDSRTEWHHCVASGKIEAFTATLKKGAHVQVEGECAAASTKRAARHGRSPNAA